MTPLRKRMIEDMQLRNLAPQTQRSYLHHIAGLARFFRISPEHLEDIRQYQVYLANHCPARRRNQSPRPGAGGFLYGVTLEPLRDPSAFAQFLAPVRQTEWVVYAKPPFGGPPQVIEYLGRYTHRVAISNQRLVALQDGQKVSFRWKDYRRPEQAQGNDGLRRGVHPPFPAACAAARLSAHPLLRLARQLPAGR